MQLNIVLLLPEKIVQRCYAVSDLLRERCKTKNTLCLDNNIPHISLCAKRTNKAGLRRITIVLDSVLKSHPKIRCYVKEVVAHKKYIGLTIRPTKSILNIRKLIQEEIEGIEMSRGSGEDQYLPHITLGRFANQSDALRAVYLVKWHAAHFASPAIGICLMGPHGTCKKLLQRYDLRKEKKKGKKHESIT